MADATPLAGAIVYGPVHSRRLGQSLGIDLLPPRSKVCELDCPYCDCGFTTPRAPRDRWPSPDEVGQALRRALERAVTAPDWITLSGRGEPTLHPRFAVVVDRVLAARDARAPAVRVAILSNGIAAAVPSVRDALRRLDARIMKLDPGPAGRVNGAALDIERVARSYQALAPVIVQAMVVRGPEWDGSSDAELAAWLPRLALAQPEAVQLTTLSRPPADARVTNVPRERLLRMAAAIAEALPRAIVRIV
ncbi:MAG TPA: radical SAM protein [Polyangia bacterium]|nr:radical SAM protein [Gemmatimonadales bacterium]HMF40154.1 radical SAM protein [Polyangia bacterium]